MKYTIKIDKICKYCTCMGEICKNMLLDVKYAKICFYM